MILEATAKEVRAVRPLGLRPVGEPQIGLVQQGGALERGIGAFPAEMAHRNPVQFRIDDFDQAIQGIPVAGAPSPEQQGDVPGF